MVPPWMVEKLEQDRREREAREQPRLRVEIQRPDVRPEPPEAEPARTSVVTIQVW